MDQELREKLINLDLQNEILREAEAEFLLKDAGRKPMEADQFLTVVTGSIAERQAKAHTTEEYIAYVKDLAEVQAKYLFEKRKYSILENAFYAELNTFKREMGLIDKQRG